VPERVNTFFKIFLKVERVILNSLVKKCGFAAWYCAFGDLPCHRLRRSRSTFDAAKLPVQKVSRLRSDAAASSELVTMSLLCRGSSTRDESVRRQIFGVRAHVLASLWESEVQLKEMRGRIALLERFAHQANIC
jgi:hypothetical protein